MQHNNGLPYGDAYIIGTPNIDRVGAMMIADQNRRDQYQAAQASQLDKEFAQNATNIRDADVPALSEKWNDYKQAKLALYKNANKLSNSDRIAAEMDAQRKLGAVISHINASKDQKVEEESAVQDMNKNPNRYNTENGYSFMAKRRTLPLSQLTTQMDPTGKPIDYSDIYGNINYKYGTTDFTKNIASAMGKEQLRGAPTDVISPDGLTTQRTQYKAYNSPREYYNSLLTGVVGSQKTADLPKEHPYSEAEANNIMDRFNALKSTPAFKSAYPDHPDFTAAEMATPAGKTMALMAMEHSLLHPPTAIETKPFNNTAALLDNKNSEWDRRNLIGFKQAMSKLTYVQGEKNKRTALLTQSNLPDIYGKLESQPVIEQPASITDGTKIKLKEIPSLTLQEQDDLLGKPDKYGERPNTPIQINGKNYIKVADDGSFLDANDNKLDADATAARTYGRLHAVKEAQAKGKVKIGTAKAPTETKRSGKFDNL